MSDAGFVPPTVPHPFFRYTQLYGYRVQSPRKVTTNGVWDEPTGRVQSSQTQKIDGFCVRRRNHFLLGVCASLVGTWALREGPNAL